MLNFIKKIFKKKTSTPSLTKVPVSGYFPPHYNSRGENEIAENYISILCRVYPKKIKKVTLAPNLSSYFMPRKIKIIGMDENYYTKRFIVAGVSIGLIQMTDSFNLDDSKTRGLLSDEFSEFKKVDWPCLSANNLGRECKILLHNPHDKTILVYCVLEGEPLDHYPYPDQQNTLGPFFK